MGSEVKTFKRLMVQKLTANFREAVVIETVPINHPKKDEICVKNKYVGVNAADINITKGGFLAGRNLPFSIGLEGIGEILEVGEDVIHIKVGESVAYRSTLINAYAEYVCLPAKDAHLVPEEIPDFLALPVSGLTASIGLDKSARIASGETVLITAAAGGVGHIAVQWAKAANCHVIGTCSSEEKARILKTLGCDRVINYKTENLDEVLTNEYKDGINVIWETIGGQIFETCLKHLSRKGRLIIAGGISGYKKEEGLVPKMNLSNLPEHLLFKCASVQGFRNGEYKDCFDSYFKYLIDSIQKGPLRILVDNGVETTGKEFFGMEGILRGVEHLHSGKSIGKVVVRIY